MQLEAIETIDIPAFVIGGLRGGVQAINQHSVEVSRSFEVIRLNVVMLSIVSLFELGAVAFLGHVVDDTASVVDDHLSVLPVVLHAFRSGLAVVWL